MHFDSKYWLNNQANYSEERLIWRTLLLLFLKFQSSNFDPPFSVLDSQNVNILTQLDFYVSGSFLIYLFLHSDHFLSLVVSEISQTKTKHFIALSAKLGE